MSYGDYILSTGGGRIAEFELVLGRFFYEHYFLGRAPVLDLAAGRCWFTRQNSRDIEAVDLAHDVVSYYAARGVKITQGSAYEIPFPPEWFEGVFCCWLFEHLHEPDRAMAEIRRVLKPGGVCVLVVPSEHQVTHGFWNDYTHVRPYTKVSLVQLATVNGFARATAAELAYTRFLSRLLPWLGPERTYRCLQANDRFLRVLHIVNRDMLTLVCYRQRDDGA